MRRNEEVIAAQIDRLKEVIGKIIPYHEPTEAHFHTAGTLNIFRANYYWHLLLCRCPSRL
jgi:hypothetical protein